MVVSIAALLLTDVTLADADAMLLAQRIGRGYDRGIRLSPPVHPNHVTLLSYTYREGMMLALERVPNPIHPNEESDWYVLIDTMIGESIGHWEWMAGQGKVQLIESEATSWPS